MKRYTLLLLIVAFQMAGKAQDSLRVRLEELLADEMFTTSQVGLMVYDLTADSALFCHHERQLMRPASCMKLVTAITALDRLGSSYQYLTRLYYTGTIADSTLTGDIYCVGGFDPMLTVSDVKALADEVRLMGIDSIAGNIYADRSMKEALDYGEGWCWDDKNPLLTPLSIGRTDAFLPVFHRALERAGVAMGSCHMLEGRLPDEGSRFLCSYHHGIGEVLQRMMKDSDNFYAESMFYQTAAAEGRRPARAADASRATKRLARRLGLDADACRIADGSGLSLYNYVSAEMLVCFLRYAWHREEVRNVLYPSLPVAGQDGTLQKRMTKGAAACNVHAKTGTVSGISSLAGYCTAANGHRLAFCIINQGVMRTQTGRDFQDRVCQTLCEYE